MRRWSGTSPGRGERVRPTFAILLTLPVATALAACGDDTEVTTTVEAQTSADEVFAAKIEAELKVYEVGFDLASMPEQQAAQLEPGVDNLPQAAGGVRVLRVTDGTVEAETDYPDDEQGAQTGRLICGAIERAAGPGEGEGSRVLGSDDAVLAECEPDDASFP